MFHILKHFCTLDVGTVLMLAIGVVLLPEFQHC